MCMRLLYKSHVKSRKVMSRGTQVKNCLQVPQINMGITVLTPSSLLVTPGECRLTVGELRGAGLSAGYPVRYS